MLYTLVYYELNRIERKVEAPTLEEAIAAAGKIEGWDDCTEEAQGTDGVEFAYDAAGNRVYDAGTVAGFYYGEHNNPEKFTEFEQVCPADQEVI